jgi:hypothetical protein
MNTELLLRVADHIEANPESFQMETWAAPAPDVNICDTVGCVAGWTVMLTEPAARQLVSRGAARMERFAWAVHAAKALDINAYQAEVLFTSSTWWGHQMHVLGFDPEDGYEIVEIDDGHYSAHDGVTAKAAAAILRGVAEGLISLDGEWECDD